MNKETLVKIMKNAASDLEYRQRLLKMPRAVLMQEGFDVPVDKQLIVLENTDDLFYVVLPPVAASKKSDAHAFKIEIRGDTFHLLGRLDAEAVEQIRDKMLQWEKNIIFDLDKLHYISSAGIGLFLMLHNKVQKSGRSMKLVHMQPAVRNVFVISGFDNIMNL